MCKRVAIELFGPMAMDKCWGGLHNLCEARTLKKTFFGWKGWSSTKAPSTQHKAHAWHLRFIEFLKGPWKGHSWCKSNIPKYYNNLNFCFGCYVNHLNIYKAYKNSKTRFGRVGHQLKPPFYIYGTTFEPPKGQIVKIIRREIIVLENGTIIQSCPMAHEGYYCNNTKGQTSIPFHLQICAPIQVSLGIVEAIL